jgi:hypothetical protein
VTVRYGIRWDGRVRPRIPHAAAAALAALALWASAARGDGAVVLDPGASAASAAEDVTRAAGWIGRLGH